MLLLLLSITSGFSPNEKTTERNSGATLYRKRIFCKSAALICKGLVVRIECIELCELVFLAFKQDSHLHDPDTRRANGGNDIFNLYFLLEYTRGTYTAI